MTSNRIPPPTWGIPDELHGILVRVFEMTATYLVYSTLFLGFAFVLLAILSRLRSSPQGTNPSTVEAIWKSAAFVPLITTTLCASVGSSHNAMKWSLCERILESVQFTSTADVHAVKSVQNQWTIDAAPTSSAPSIEPFDPESNLAMQSVHSESSQTSSRSLKRHRSIPMDSGDDTRVNESFAPGLTALETSLQSQSSESNLVPARQLNAAQRLAFQAVIWSGMGILAWFLLCSGRLLLKALLLERWLKTCSTIRSDLRRELNSLVPNGDRIRLLRASKMDQAKCRLRGGIRSEPFACGVLRWTIVLPEGIEEQLSRDDLRALLTHEIAHLVRRDPAWQWLGQTLCTFLAFQPLNFLARREWQQATEMLSNDRAIAHDVEATRLASCLTRIAEWRWESRQKFDHLSIGVPAVGSPGSLTRRIEWMLRTRHTTNANRGQRVPILLAVAAGLSVGFNGPRIDLASVARAEAKGDALALDDEGEMLRKELRTEFSRAHDDLVRLQSQLNRLSDPKIEEISKRLIEQISKIQSELKD